MSTEHALETTHFSHRVHESIPTHIQLEKCQYECTAKTAHFAILIPSIVTTSSLHIEIATAPPRAEHPCSINFP
jgi:hypothetical protein